MYRMKLLKLNYVPGCLVPSASGLCLALALLQPQWSVAAASLPRPQGHVSDHAALLDANTRSQLNALLGRLARKTGSELAVVTLADIGGEDPEGYAVKLFADWGIGKKDKNNGVLILVAMKERKIRIEVGYGLEGVLPDGLGGQIIRERMEPAFKKQQFGQGLIAGTLAVATIMAKEAGISLEDLGGRSAPVSARGRPMSRGQKLFRLLLFIIMIPIIIRNPWLLLLFMGGMGGRGGWSGGGFGGGFGGFGGGMSGGGGAGGGW